jgi:pilus assembly protein FimV
LKHSPQTSLKASPIVSAASSITKKARAFALSSVAAAAMILTLPSAHALGLGRLAVQSALGENLRAEIDVISLTPEESGSLKVRVASPEAYKAAGVDYNAVLPNVTATLQRRSDGRPYLRVTSDRAVQEPFVDVILELQWGAGRLVREYTMLFDPPGGRTAVAQAPAAVAPVIGAAAVPAAPADPVSAAEPAQAPAVAASVPALPAASAAATDAKSGAAAPRGGPARTIKPNPAERLAAPAKAQGTKSAAAPAKAREPNPAPSPRRFTGDEYTVKSGDTLTRIAGATRREGVSLDQMLVALLRSNSDAFVGNNMNVVKTGAVLKVPQVGEVQAVAPDEAKRVIQAQSTDFETYRSRLASGVKVAKAEESLARSASGAIEARVDDKKAAALTPDKLTLNRAGAAGAAAGADAKVSKDTEKKEQTARMSELARNVDDLRKLREGNAGTPATAGSGGGGVVAPGVAAAAAAASASAAAAPKPPVVAQAPAASPAPLPAPPSQLPTATTTLPVAPPAIAASTPNAAAVAMDAPASSATPATPAESVANAPPVKEPPPVIVKPSVKPTVTTAETPSAMTQIMDDYPWALAALGFLGVLGAGYGAYRFKNRTKVADTETSFLESRLQPDSFFGASGGQRIDTRDASSQSSSSMSYSLSQLDAIGDVDPVAEADVYLAYGRDLQAEEILKEAMRTNPDRLAIRTKLLEVYNKRRDTKGFELLAGQLHTLTKGTGEDWARVQELGLQIDPENALYKLGGRPSSVTVGTGGALISERLNATTQPQSTMAMSAAHAPMTEFPDRTGPASTVDLDLGTVAAKKKATGLDLPPLVSGAATTPIGPAGQMGAFAATMTSSVSAKASGVATAAAGASVAGIATATTTSFASKLPPSLSASSLSSLSVPAGDATAASTTMSMAFDLEGLDLDLPKIGKSDPGPVTTSAADAMFAKSESGPVGLSMPSSFESGDPLARKVELAEEFRHIGDVNGARDLLQEVIAKGSGEVKARAQGMLDRLA